MEYFNMIYCVHIKIIIVNFVVKYYESRNSHITITEMDI